jgi:hypothetical protein
MSLGRPASSNLRFQKVEDARPKAFALLKDTGGELPYEIKLPLLSSLPKAIMWKGKIYVLTEYDDNDTPIYEEALVWYAE